MKILTRKDIYPAYRELYFELIEARHFINLSLPSWGAEDYLFVAGDELWERKVVTVWAIEREDDYEDLEYDEDFQIV